MKFKKKLFLISLSLLFITTISSCSNNTNYNITYHLDGGTNSSSNVSTYNDAKSLSLESASKAGYTFEGWYLDSNYTKLFNNNVSGNIDLYAKFVPIVYKINYISIDDIDNNNPKTYTIEDEIELEDPTYKYDNFLGWYNDIDCKTDAITKIEKGTTGDITLYAKYPLLYSYLDEVGPINLYGREINLTYTNDDKTYYTNLGEEILNDIKEEKIAYEKLEEKIDILDSAPNYFYNEYQISYLLADMTATSDAYDLKSEIYSLYKKMYSYIEQAEYNIYNSIYKDNYYYGYLELETAEEVEAYYKGLNPEVNKAISDAATNLNNAENDYYAGKYNAFDTLAKIVKYGNELAVLSGYDNYIYYSYSESYDRDYQPTDVAKLKPYIRDYIAPIYDYTNDYIANFEANATSEELITYNQLLSAQFGYYMEYIYNYSKEVGSDYEENFNNLLKTGNYFLSNAINDNITAYQWDIDDVPYLYFSYDYQSMDTFIHEFGHYNAYIVAEDEGSYDLLETQSQGNELLFYVYLLNQNAINKNIYATYLAKMLNEFARVILQGYLYNELEMYIYNQDYDNTTIEETIKYWDTLCDEIGSKTMKEAMTYEAVADRLIRYSAYYISYTTSALASIELMGFAYDDFSLGVEIYNKIYANYTDDPEINNFMQVISHAGLKDVFSEEAYVTISKFINNLKVDVFEPNKY